MPREVATAQGTKQAHGPQLKLLYLFAGAARKSSVVEQLKSMCARKGISFHAEEVDIERCESHDLTNTSLQKSLSEGIRSRRWQYILAGAGCKQGRASSCARRTTFLGLSQAADLRRCRLATSSCASPAKCYRPLWTAPSIWQLSELRSLAGRGNPPFFTVVFNQCSFGAPYRKPTRLLTNLPDIQHWGPKEWPSMDMQGFYEGPLLQHCGCKSHVQLVKKPLDTAFKTTGTACYPEKMDQGIATAVLGAWQKFCPPTASCRLGNVLQAGMIRNEGTAMEASEGMVRNEGAAKVRNEGKAMETNEGMVRNEGMAKEAVGNDVKEKKDVGEAIPGRVAAPPKSRVLPAGKGPPMMAYYKGKSRPVNDGGCGPR